MPWATSPDSSHRARDTATTMLDHSKHCGEMATKTDKFFVAHTVNCVLCNYLTRIDWMLFNFTPVIQQNCHQLRWKFEKWFCTVDKLRCQNPNPANSGRVDLDFDIVNYLHLITLHVVWDIHWVQTSVLLKLYGPVLCRNRRDIGNIIPITRLRPDCFTLCKTCHVIYYTPRFNEVKRGLYWFHVVCPSVCPSVDKIVSALYLPQY